MKETDQFFLNQQEPARSCMSALRHFILNYDSEVSEIWRYKMPFYAFGGKRFCYIWLDKKRNQPYVGIVDGKLIEHPDLILENRSRMKIILVDPHEDLPVETLNAILAQAIALLSR